MSVRTVKTQIEPLEVVSETTPRSFRPLDTPQVQRRLIDNPTDTPPNSPIDSVDPDGSSFADSGFDDSLLRGVAGISDQVMLPKLGEQIGDRYEIIERLGEGGMGVVFRARDLELDRMVAIKFIKGGRARGQGPGHTEQFLTEARATARTNHNNIVTVYNLGTWTEVPYLVMEHLQGQTLSALLAEGAIDPKSAVGLMLQVAQGLERAHNEGISHRDLKPSNIFITEDGTAKILDFGLALLESAREAPLPNGDERSRLKAGTRPFMAPEQWRGEPQDDRTDIWALGVILYELVTGDLPYGLSGSGPSPSTINPPPSIRDHVPGLPKSLDLCVSKMMAVAPNDRFQSATELIETLSSIEPDFSGRVRKIHSLPFLLIAAGLVAVFLARNQDSSLVAVQNDEALTTEQSNLNAAVLQPEKPVPDRPAIVSVWPIEPDLEAPVAPSPAAHVIAFATTVAQAVPVQVQVAIATTGSSSVSAPSPNRQGRRSHVNNGGGEVADPVAETPASDAPSHGVLPPGRIERAAPVRF